MKCFKQDVDIENKLKQAIFAIEDIINSKPIQKLNWQEFIRELEPIRNSLEWELQKYQDGEYEQ